ncbi:S9 family peptidase [Lichenihabitans psoromatis]|uniref:S9 family peptidase n=1 Tax=Lichenihabitans psoromatis TaxID=2528642 RepID=UPI0010384EBC
MTSEPPFASAQPPAPAERRSSLTIVHGLELDDPYAWLKASNWQEVLRKPSALPTDIKAVLDRENSYADAVLAPTSDLQTSLIAEMRARIKEDDSDVPVSDGPFDYYVRHRDNGQHEIVCRRPRDTEVDETILLDGDVLAEGHPFFEIGAAQHSPDHRLLAWSADLKGSELFTLQVRDIEAGSDLADRVPQTDGNAVWFADCASFLYVRMDDNHRASSVYRHRLGSSGDVDDLVFHEPDPGWFVSIERLRSGQFAVISVHGHDATENHLVDLSVTGAISRHLIAAREPGLRYDVDQRHDRLFIRTNADGAEDFKIVEAPLFCDGRVDWVDLVPHRAGRLLLHADVYRNHLVRLERENGLPRIVVRTIESGEEHSIHFDEDAYYLGLGDVAEQDTQTIRFSYSSLTTPDELFDYDMGERRRILRKRRELPSGHDPEQYVSRRVFATAADGETVPISLLYRKDTPLDGSAPLLLYGYGAYGYAIPAAFGANRLSLVDRGFVFAIAHIRGGTDKGWAWYTKGKLAHKPNTFNDFIAAAHHLSEAGYTARGRIVAQGGSAGGMLMGAVANMAPGLFAGIIADVPFVDVLTTMLDADLPLTPPEWLEWGNPILDRTAFDTIRSYSPYDNVAPRPYPPILALGGLTDPRVTYWEPAKWVAKLRATASGGPILLKTNMEAGHGGASGRFDRLEEIALEYAFAMTCVSPAAPAR